jgi:hypothetical protein
VTQHLIEDTRVTVDATQRLVARAPVDPPPTIEWTDPLRLNARQACELRRRLLVEEVLEEPPVNTLMIVEVVSVLLTLATEPHALPTLWEDAEECTLVQVPPLCVNHQRIKRDVLTVAGYVHRWSRRLPTRRRASWTQGNWSRPW